MKSRNIYFTQNTQIMSFLVVSLPNSFFWHYKPIGAKILSSLVWILFWYATPVTLTQPTFLIFSDIQTIAYSPCITCFCNVKTNSHSVLLSMSGQASDWDVIKSRFVLINVQRNATTLTHKAQYNSKGNYANAPQDI